MNDKTVIYGADGTELQASKRGPSLKRVAICVGVGWVIVGVLLAASFTRKNKPDSGATATSLMTPGSSITWMNPSVVNDAGEIWNHRPILNAPSDAPPRKIRVGPYLYRVRYTSAMALNSQNAYALSDTINKHEIWLNPKRDLRTDLMHELMHCAKDVGTGASYLSTSGSEEDIIHVTAPTMVSILRDNPALTAWLIK